MSIALYASHRNIRALGFSFSPAAFLGILLRDLARGGIHDDTAAEEAVHPPQNSRLALLTIPPTRIGASPRTSFSACVLDIEDETLATEV